MKVESREWAEECLNQRMEDKPEGGWTQFETRTKTFFVLDLDA